MTTDQSVAYEADDLADVLGVWSCVGSGGYCVPAEAGAAAPSVNRVVGYGDEVTVTAELIEASRDRNGHSALLDTLRDEAGQLSAHGQLVWKRGAWPENVRRVRPGSPQHVALAQDLRDEAWRLSDPDERTERLRELRAEFGESFFGDLARSRTLGTYNGGSGRGEPGQPIP